MATNEQKPGSGTATDDTVYNDLESGEVKVKDKGQPALEPKDPNVVDWDGPDDPANPRNWKWGVKLAHVLLVSSFTLYSNFAAVIFAPGAQDLVTEFNITDNVVASLTVTIYLVGFCAVYHICNAVYIAFTIGCALSTNTAMFLVFRFICGCAASSPMSIGGGTIADIHAEAERGKAMALFGMGPLLGPWAIGPVIGGFVSEDIGWRWTFWLILILSTIFSLIGLVVMRETYEPVLLDRKAAQLRKATGSNKPRPRTYNKDLTPGQRLKHAIMRPIMILILSPIALLLSTYCAFMFGLIYLLITTFPAVFEDTYHWGPSIAGLAYLGLGVGMIFSVGIFSILSDKLLHQPKQGTVDFAFS